MDTQEFAFLKKYDLLGGNSNFTINKLLKSYQSVVKISNFVEIVDCNKFKIIKKKYLIEQVMRQPVSTPFRFVYYIN